MTDPLEGFAASLFDAPPPVGKFTREELEAQARAKRMAGPPRMFSLGTEACPDCGALFGPAPSRPSFGVAILHQCGREAAPVTLAAPVRATLRDQRPNESDDDYRARCRADYDARVAAGTIRPVHAPEPKPRKPHIGAEPHKGRTYGMVFLSYNIDPCNRCGAESTYAGAVRGDYSWAHTCELPEAACP